MREKDLKVDLAGRIWHAIFAAIACPTARIGSCQQRVAARRTEWRNSICRQKCSSAACESVELGKESVSRTVCTQNVPGQVIRDDEQHIGWHVAPCVRRCLVTQVGRRPPSRVRRRGLREPRSAISICFKSDDDVANVRAFTRFAFSGCDSISRANVRSCPTCSAHTSASLTALSSLLCANSNTLPLGPGAARRAPRHSRAADTRAIAHKARPLPGTRKSITHRSFCTHTTHHACSHCSRATPHCTHRRRSPRRRHISTPCVARVERRCPLTREPSSSHQPVLNASCSARISPAPLPPSSSRHQCRAH